MISIDLLHVFLALIALSACGGLLWLRHASAPRIAALEAQLAAERELRVRLEDQRAIDIQERKSLEDSLRARAEAAERRLEAGVAEAAERERSLAREREMQQRIQKEAEARFGQLAGEALAKTQEQFVALADQTLQKHRAGAQGEIGALLKPIQETFGQFREKVEQIEKVRSEDRAALAQQIVDVGSAVRETKDAAGKLASALAAPRHGGRWGEETLRNVLELAGLSPYADFVEQSSNDTDRGRQRPDVVVRMPGGRCLVIDSKVSLDDYLAASEETDPQRRKQKLGAHAARVRQHVASLTRKDYAKGFADRVDFVAMFIPGENFYAAVLEYDRDIFDYASRNNVVIVTPSTLIALAKSVAYGWRQEEMAHNAEEAKKLGQELYERLNRFLEHLGKVGHAIDAAGKSYNVMIGSLESRVMPTVRKLENLNFSESGKAVAGPQPVEATPRQLTLLDAPPNALIEAEAAAAALQAAAASGKRR